MVQEEVIFHGHKNVRSLHARTIEITKDSNLTLRGDCIIGVSANKSCQDMSEELQRVLKNDSSSVTIDIMVGNKSFKINGFGNKRLLLLSKHDIVIRKTNFICERTMAIRCDKASYDIPRDLIFSLQNPETKGIFRITTE
ncbi:MAG: DUF371 domain-containing protein [Nitrososphaeraceae archaeon]